MTALVTFWVSVGLIAYTYFLFPLLIVVRGWLRPRPFTAGDTEADLAILLAAYNEQESIGGCIESLLNLDYPKERMRIVVASDGSTDRTEDIVRQYADRGVQLMVGPRRGKIETLNETVPALQGEVLVFTDANIHFRRDALRALVRPFADPAVGGVAGNPIYVRDLQQSLTADGECAYWGFERVMRMCQGAAGHVTSANGAIYALRRHLFRPVPRGASDDFVISTQVIAQGHRLVYTDTARALELVPIKAKTEFSRKVRLVTVGLYSVWVMRGLLNPFRHGFYAWQVAWQKVLRRLMVIPLILLLLISPWLWVLGPFYRCCVVGQAAFYTLALLGLALRDTRPGGSKILTLPFFFCMANVAALVAVINLVRGKRFEVWTPTRASESS